MGAIHINRNRQNLGQYSEQDVADGLQTGKFLPDDLAWQEPMEAWLPLSTFTNLPPPTEALPPPPPALDGPPLPSSQDTLVWEAPERPPAFQAALATIRQVLSNPVAAFQSMPTQGGFRKPMAFYVWVSWITGIFAVIYEAVAILINPDALATTEFKSIPREWLIPIFIGAIIILPALQLVRSYISSGVIHLALLLVGGAKKPFETTYRVFCYAAGSSSVLQLIPICGAWFHLILSLCISVIGLKEAHGTDLWRPVLAVFLIFVLCAGTVVGVSALAVGLGYASLGAIGK